MGQHIFANHTAEQILIKNLPQG